MAKQATKSSQRKDTRSRKVRDLPARPLGARKAASVGGGIKAGKERTDYLAIKMNDVIVSGS
jgi:hypothetical protein